MKGPARSGALGAAALVAMALLLAACGGGAHSAFDVPATTTPGVVLSTEASPAGRILATGTGHTLYDFAPDTTTNSRCVTSICIRLWPPLIVQATPTVAKGLQSSLAGTIRRPDGTLQATYGGHPLYTWIGDGRAGMITGQALLNAGGYWYVIGPTGRQINTAFRVTR